MSKVADENEQIRWIARVFYRLKGQQFPERFFTPKHKMWIHFVRARIWIKGIGALKDWQRFLEAQFHYSRDKGATLFPTMLYNLKATLKYRDFCSKMARRGGVVRVEELKHSRVLSSGAIESRFKQGAWNLEAYERRGIRDVVAMSTFQTQFYPLFVLANEEAWDLVSQGFEGFGPEVRRRYLRLREYKPEQLERALTRLRRLYDDARSQQRRIWEGYSTTF